MRARELMMTPPITCHVNDPLNLAAARMWDGDIGGLLVVNDEGKLTGMITDRDICMAAYTQGRALDAILVNSAMATHVASARPDTSIADIARLMAEHQVHRIPIVDDAGKPLGVVSTTDLAIESARPDSRMKHGPSNFAHTVAAICKPRAIARKAA